MPRNPRNIIGQVFGGYKVVRGIAIEKRLDEQKDRAWRCCCIGCGAAGELSLPQLKSNKRGCRRCSSKLGNEGCRIRPYESLFRAIRARAAREEDPKHPRREFNITYEEFVDLIKVGRCHYCHVPLIWAEFSIGVRGQKHQLDRKDNKIGYAAGNLVVCCTRCNYGKGSTFSYEEWWVMTEPFRSGRLLAGRVVTGPRARRAVS